MFFETHLLSIAIWLPIIFGVMVLATGGDHNAPLARILAMLGAVLGFLVTIPLYTGFVRDTSDMQFVEMVSWITRFNINYHLGVDGISVLFVLLTAFFTPIVVLAGWLVIEKRVAQYMAAFLIMSGIMIGVFAALDAMLFYVFWEAMLIPMFLIIGVWGGANRVYAAVKFFLYTLLGSLLMLVALIYLYNQSGGSFEIMDFHLVSIPMSAQIFIFIAFFFANVLLFGFPADSNGLFAPFRAAATGSNGFVADFDEHGIGVDRRKNPDGDP